MSKIDSKHIGSFQRWEPIDNISAQVTCEGIHDDYEGFRVLLRCSDERVLRLSYARALAYRNVDEGDRLRTLRHAHVEPNWSLYTVENSSFLRWFHLESDGIHTDENVKHYAIYTLNDCIDILANSAPFAEWL